MSTTEMPPERGDFPGAALALPQGDDIVWQGHRVIWKREETWLPQLTAWLLPRFKPKGLERLKPGSFRDICWDDSDWLSVLQRSVYADVDSIAESLANALDRAVLLTYHACRTEDVGAYLKGGLRVHSRQDLEARLRAIVEADEDLAWIRKTLDTRIAEAKNDLDPGRLYVVADDQLMLDHAGHYLIYGSEWITAVLGGSGRRALQRLGLPTMLEIDLPLRLERFSMRQAFARQLMQEWTRRVCNRPNWAAPIDFSFCLEVDLPGEYIVGHYHPAEIRDPLYYFEVYKSPATSCAFCSK